MQKEWKALAIALAGLFVNHQAFTKDAEPQRPSFWKNKEDFEKSLKEWERQSDEYERACPSAEGMEWAKVREGGSVCRPMSENKRALRKYCTAPQNKEELTACVDAIDRMPCALPSEKEYSKKNVFEIARKYSLLRVAAKGGNEKASELIRSLPSGMPTLECSNTPESIKIDSSSSARALKSVSDEWDKIKEKRCRTKQEEELKRERRDPSSKPMNAIEQAKRRIQCSHYQAVDFAGKPVIIPVKQSVDGIYSVSAQTGIVKIYDMNLCAEVRKTLESGSFACYLP